MSKVSPDNYVAIQGWMITDLNLKGNELLIYAVIYGFSQDGESQFTGSLQYLADWCNSSKESARKVVKNLLEKQLLIKEDNIVNGIKFCKYKAIKPKKEVDGIQQSCTGIQQSCTGGIQQSCTNNIDIYNINNNIDNVEKDLDDIPYKEIIEYLNTKTDKQQSCTGGIQQICTNNINKYNRSNNIDNVEKDLDTIPYTEIINYLNDKTNKHFRNSTQSKKLISGRFRDGYKLEDFKKVIDIKTQQWLNDSKMNKYLRPETLFKPSNFDSYLNETPSKIQINNQSYLVNTSDRRHTPRRNRD